MTDWGTGEYERTAQAIAQAADRALVAAAPRPGERLVDVACGTGNAALRAARAGADVVGVDLAERLLDVARGAAAAEGLDATFVTGDATALPFPDDTFDVAISVFGVIFARPGEQGAAELLRVVRPGGRIVVTTWVPEGAIHDVGRLAQEAVDALTPDPEPGPPPSPWGQEEGLRRLFAPHPVEVGEEPLVFTGRSPEAWLQEQFDHHPLWLSLRAELTGTALWDDLVLRIREVLEAANEDLSAFRTTSRYLVATVLVG